MLSGFDSFKPASKDLFFKSEKTGDPRMGEISLPFNGNEPGPGDFVLAGYPDDEGILLNSGRVGAAQAPDAIRSRFYKTSLSQNHLNQTQLIDLGNLSSQLSLGERHEAGKQVSQKCIEAGARWIGLGGGHDYGYPDGAGFLLANRESKLKPLIINFDAHLDVRPLDKGLSSGTPFYRLLTDNHLPEFDFFEIGIQKQCNSTEHIRWAKDHGAQILFYEDMILSGDPPLQYMLSHLAESMIKPRPCFISVDIDCFSTAYAMGCSQSWPMGFRPEDIIPLIGILQKNLNAQALGIYEVSPPLDRDECTVKLATQILYEFTGSSL